MMCTLTAFDSCFTRNASSRLAKAKVSSRSPVAESMSSRLAITIVPLNESVTSRPM